MSYTFPLNADHASSRLLWRFNSLGVIRCTRMPSGRRERSSAISLFFTAQSNALQPGSRTTFFLFGAISLLSVARPSSSTFRRAPEAPPTPNGAVFAVVVGGTANIPARFAPGATLDDCVGMPSRDRNEVNLASLEGGLLMVAGLGEAPSTEMAISLISPISSSLVVLAFVPRLFVVGGLACFLLFTSTDVIDRSEGFVDGSQNTKEKATCNLQEHDRVL